MDAYELTHKILDLQRDQAASDDTDGFDDGFDEYCQNHPSPDDLYTEAIDRQNVIVKVSYWQNNDKHVFAFPENATFESVIRNIIVLGESYEAEHERLERRDDEGEINITLNEAGRQGFTTRFPDGTDYDQVRDDIKAVIRKYRDAADPEIVAMQEAELDRLERCN